MLKNKSMPFHFTVASHDAQPVKALGTLKRPTKPEELLDSTWGIKAKPVICAELLQSSFAGKELELFTVLGTANGFVDTVRSAYNGHHHLTLRFVNLFDPFSQIFHGYYY
jgi:hypothetical protein